ncbi:hypothetical protein L2E82_24485 [Cichorium intybus]|uniref:Uncharacterized protein n=1 Tax=Cichorium intybus TaxID=13427 RepID=A0ACB9E0Z1_CICIN|nr:hypothetical protein L2E82_24485 [Cichorium intybus]
MPIKDSVSWNTIISGFFTRGFYNVGFDYFKTIYSSSGSHRFDRGTITTILSACEGSQFSNVNKMIHTLVIIHGYERETTIANALITSYFTSESFHSAKQVFEEINDKNVVTYTAMISGLAQNHHFQDSLKVFVEMPRGFISPNILTYLSTLMACSGLQALSEGCQIHALVSKLGMDSDLHIESALMDMYSKCGSMQESWQIFESARVLDEVSMTVILAGFAQNGCEEESVRVFSRMIKEGIKIDPNTISVILTVFNGDISLAFGVDYLQNRERWELELRKCVMHDRERQELASLEDSAMSFSRRFGTQFSSNNYKIPKDFIQKTLITYVMLHKKSDV